MMAKTSTQPEAKRARYVEMRGGRKTAHARVRLVADKKGIIVNDKPYTDYFRTPKLQYEVESAFRVTDTTTMGATVRVEGGGIHAQAQAVRHGIALALIYMKPDLKKRLRREGFVTRDARTVERKKYGLKKARRAPQWQKR